MSKQTKIASESVRRIWQTYFPDVELTETRWFEALEPCLLQEGMRIAAERRRNGRHFRTVDEKNIGKYIRGIIRKLKTGETVKKEQRGSIVKAEVWFLAGYRITENDKSRFREYLMPAGDCLLFKGASTTGGYGKFWVNDRSVAVHFFAFFSELGYLPAANALGGINGLQVAHSCRNRTCCNPRHLRLTTKTVNLMERVHNFVDRAVDSVRRIGYGSRSGSIIDTHANTVAPPFHPHQILSDKRTSVPNGQSHVVAGQQLTSNNSTVSVQNSGKSVVLTDELEEANAESLSHARTGEGVSGPLVSPVEDGAMTL